MPQNSFFQLFCKPCNAVYDAAFSRYYLATLAFYFRYFGELDDAGGRLAENSGFL
jgi:hypothetical protein